MKKERSDLSVADILFHVIITCIIPIAELLMIFTENEKIGIASTFIFMGIIIVIIVSKKEMIGGIVRFNIIYVSVLAIIKDIAISHEPKAVITWLLVDIVIIRILVMNHTKSGKEIVDGVNNAYAKLHKKEEEEKKRQVQDAIYRTAYAGKPAWLDEKQVKEYDDAYFKTCKKLADMGAHNVSSSLTREELYTLWFIQKTFGSLTVNQNDGEKISVYVKIKDSEAVVDMEEHVKEALAPYKMPEIVSNPVKKRRINKKAIRKQRRAHRQAEARKKLAKTNRALAAEEAKRRRAKKRQAPNYEYFAKEWVSQNMGYVNKLIAGATICGNKYADAVIPSDKLPQETVTRQLIAKKLKDDGVICRYEIEINGIAVKAKTKYA